MTYTPTLWENLSLPAIDAANLSNIENFNVAVAAGGRSGVQAGSLASEHAGLPIGVQLPLNATLIWTDSNMGAGSGLDADKLDGQHGSYYMPVAGVGTAVAFGALVTFNGGLTVPSGQVLTVNGTISVSGGSISNLSSLSCSGTITAAAFNVSSTRDIKDNIDLFKFNAAEIVNATPVYRYTLKADLRKDYHVGFIVEESPSCFVSADNSGIDLYAALAVAYKAIQELSARIETLERK